MCHAWRQGIGDCLLGVIRATLIGCLVSELWHLKLSRRLLQPHFKSFSMKIHICFIPFFMVLFVLIFWQVSVESEKIVVTTWRNQSFHKRHGQHQMSQVSNSANNVLRARRGVIRMLVVVLLTFALCNLPFHARKIWQYWWVFLFWFVLFLCCSSTTSYACLSIIHRVTIECRTNSRKVNYRRTFLSNQT